jgi:hypothetical protein
MSGLRIAERETAVESLFRWLDPLSRDDPTYKGAVSVGLISIP